MTNLNLLLEKLNNGTATATELNQVRLLIKKAKNLK